RICRDRLRLQYEHVRERMAMVEFVDTHQLLHRLRRQTRLVPPYDYATADLVVDLKALDLVRVVHLECGIRLRQRRDRRPIPLRLRQRISRLAPRRIAQHPDPLLPKRFTLWSLARGPSAWVGDPLEISAQVGRSKCRQ